MLQCFGESGRPIQTTKHGLIVVHHPPRPNKRTHTQEPRHDGATVTLVRSFVLLLDHV
jgi:hypothetical protein